ncbi:hypothetical protein AC579_6745 [Pseudocercospora musae]|uniref:WW domain-containing protein n=1 Tax=Pseudocercospora musae TaxID=113226 RepID=A0A139I5G6_9PEZI|nr:hypothetical protein AC579_6745 [Pseudocercospora musae]KXT09866.1 hypothetical protein AC579_6745 [Pseudocercospora musae]KXT09868.1 hypothetical protein AC579_6745 [Pseudocercospora musae]KXT09869.1 hypothetical protein AC579_6745 [Pseudocercospora musae]
MDISGSVGQCLQAFTDLEHHLEGQNLSSKSIQHEHARFRIWVGNLSAHRPTGRRSLEFRLRDSSNLRRRVITLLNDLCSELHECSSASIVEDDILDDTENYLEIEMARDGSPTSIDPARGVRDIVNLLYRFSLTLRNPAGHSRIRDAIAKSHSVYLPYDIEHVREKFPNIAEALVHRLGKATSAKRQYLRYREDHHDKKSSGLNVLENDRLETSTNDVTTVATPLPSNDAFLFSKSETETVYSMTSFAPTSSSTASLRPPPMPAGSMEGEAFQCPICFSIVSCDSEHAWRQHVFEDLPPYICLEAACEQPDTTYSRRRDWQRHMLRAHRSTWNCPFDCGQTHSALTQARSHTLNEHSHSMDMSRLDALLESNRQAKHATSDLSCVLCGQSTSNLQDWCRHVGHHLEQLALFALPSHLLGEDGEDDTERSNLSDISSTAKSSAAPNLANPSIDTMPGDGKASIIADSALAADADQSAEVNNADPGPFTRPLSPIRTSPRLPPPPTIDPLPLGWHESIAENGSVYYWTRSGRTTWQRPTSPPPPHPLHTPPVQDQRMPDVRINSSPGVVNSDPTSLADAVSRPLSPSYFLQRRSSPDRPIREPLAADAPQMDVDHDEAQDPMREAQSRADDTRSPVTSSELTQGSSVPENLEGPPPTSRLNTSRGASAFAMDANPVVSTGGVYQGLSVSGDARVHLGDIYHIGPLHPTSGVHDLPESRYRPQPHFSLIAESDLASSAGAANPSSYTTARAYPQMNAPSQGQSSSHPSVGGSSSSGFLLPSSYAEGPVNPQMYDSGQGQSFSNPLLIGGSSNELTRKPMNSQSSVRTLCPPSQGRRGTQISSEGQHMCPECHVAFSDPSALAHHARIHIPAAQRPHACHQCYKRFSYRKDLMRHLATHDPSTPRYFCPHIDCAYNTKGLASRGSLDRHMRSKHPP